MLWSYNSKQGVASIYVDTVHACVNVEGWKNVGAELWRDEREGWQGGQREIIISSHDHKLNGCTYPHPLAFADTPTPLHRVSRDGSTLEQINRRDFFSSSRHLSPRPELAISPNRCRDSFYIPWETLAQIRSHFLKNCPRAKPF